MRSNRMRSKRRQSNKRNIKINKIRRKINKNRTKMKKTRSRKTRSRKTRVNKRSRIRKTKRRMRGGSGDMPARRPSDPDLPLSPAGVEIYLNRLITLHEKGKLFDLEKTKNEMKKLSEKGDNDSHKLLIMFRHHFNALEDAYENLTIINTPGYLAGVAMRPGAKIELKKEAISEYIEAARGYRIAELEFYNKKSELEKSRQAAEEAAIAEAAEEAALARAALAEAAEEAALSGAAGSAERDSLEELTQEDEPALPPRTPAGHTPPSEWRGDHYSEEEYIGDLLSRFPGTESAVPSNTERRGT